MSATGSVGLLPLSQRLRWSSGVRLAVAAAPVLTWLLLPATRTGALEDLVAPAVVLAGVALLGLVFPSLRSGRRLTLAGLAAGLLVDGAYLGWAFLLLGGLSGPIGQVMLLHTIAATLLLSFRTGLKLATWHSMVLLVVLQAQVVGLSPGPLTGEPFPTELRLRLEHMIVSHHGSHEFGSPKPPMTPEAIALNCLDNLDAKIHLFTREIRDDPSRESNWTPFHPGLGRKLYKGDVATNGVVVTPES